MARQYFVAGLADSLISPIGAVSPATTPTSLFSVAQANKFLPLPYGQNAPSPGQIFRIVCGGLMTTTTGTLIIAVYHGPGTTATAFGTLIATSNTFTPTASITAGYWRLEGTLIYRAISEVTNSSTVWFAAGFDCVGPSGGSLADVSTIISSNAAVSTVDTTGSGTAGTFGALNVAVTPSVTGSTWTPQYAFMQSIN